MRAATFSALSLVKLVHEVYRKWPWKKAATRAQLLKGTCVKDAKTIQAAVGGKILRIRPRLGGAHIGRVYDVSGKLITEDGFRHHAAVRLGDYIFDRITGPAGLHIDDYKRLFADRLHLEFKVLD